MKGKSEWFYVKLSCGFEVILFKHLLLDFSGPWARLQISMGRCGGRPCGLWAAHSSSTEHCSCSGCNCPRMALLASGSPGSWNSAASPTRFPWPTTQRRPAIDV